eukprot:7142989-Prymnesium_polylepis.2
MTRGPAAVKDKTPFATSSCATEAVGHQQWSGQVNEGSVEEYQRHVVAYLKKNPGCISSGASGRRDFARPEPIP